MDGRKQLKKAVPRYETPPTVSTESVLITATIGAHEGCNIRICDISGAFLSAHMDKEVNISLYGRLAELIVNIAPQI